MTTEVFCLCDAATNDSGKLNILGAFDTIWVKDFPVIYPHCALGIRLRFLSAERGEHRLNVRFINEDGKDILPPTGGPFKVDMPETQRSAVTNLILNIQSLKLEKLGEYGLELSIDGQQILSLPLFIKSMPAPAH